MSAPLEELIDQRVDARVAPLAEEIRAVAQDVRRLDAKVDAVERRLDAKIDGVEQRLGARIDCVAEDVRRLDARIDDTSRALQCAIHAEIASAVGTIEERSRDHMEVLYERFKLEVEKLDAKIEERCPVGALRAAAVRQTPSPPRARPPASKKKKPAPRR